jgi:hypothetical protein
MGRRKGGPSRTGTKGAYLNRYVTDEQRSRRPIFIPTLRAGAQLVVFPRCSLDPYDSNGCFARALKNSQLTCGETQAQFCARDGWSLSLLQDRP